MKSVFIQTLFENSFDDILTAIIDKSLGKAASSSDKVRFLVKLQSLIADKLTTLLPYEDD